MIGIKETGAFSDTDAKLRGRVIAKDIYENNYDLSLISVDTGELQVINDAKAAGQTAYSH